MGRSFPISYWHFYIQKLFLGYFVFMSVPRMHQSKNCFFFYKTQTPFRSPIALPGSTPPAREGCSLFLNNSSNFLKQFFDPLGSVPTVLLPSPSFLLTVGYILSRTYPLHPPPPQMILPSVLHHDKCLLRSVTLCLERKGWWVLFLPTKVTSCKPALISQFLQVGSLVVQVRSA